jgi:hypothetical protein
MADLMAKPSVKPGLVKLQTARINEAESSSETSLPAKFRLQDKKEKNKVEVRVRRAMLFCCWHIC